MQSLERDAEATSSKASKAEFSKNYDQAFRLYIKTAESFLHLSRSTTADDRHKQRWKASAAKALERAEKIKRFIEVPKTPSQSLSTPAPENLGHLTPIGIDHFSPQEQFYVLKRGSTVNGLQFPLWEETTQRTASTSSAFTDPDGQPKLSPEQEKVSPVWQRAHSLGQSSVWTQRRRILPQDILQHVVTDCSVCASVSVFLEHDHRFNSQDNASELQRATKLDSRSVDGRYDIRILFNAIDNYLPFHPTEDVLMCMSILPSSRGEHEEILWPSLLEKAYMKLMGGYDFPGSNSSIDLHALAGWIPEHIDIKRQSDLDLCLLKPCADSSSRSTFEREKSWERIDKGYSSGQCLVTLGTGPSSQIYWRRIPLLPSHSYAVLNVYEGEEGRMLTVLDSWVRSGDDRIEPSRLLEIPWAEILNTFEGIYLSWDPKIWSTVLNFHGMWKRNKNDDDGLRQIQMAFTRTGLADEEIWVLLTRHVVDSHRDSDFIALQVELDDELSQSTKAVDIQSNLSARGTYTNSTHVLSRVRIPKSQKSGILSISASYDGGASEVGFTLSAYAEEGTKISWIKNKPSPPFMRKLEDSFTSKNAGGNCTYQSFMVNPQYHLMLRPAESRTGGISGAQNVTITLQTNKDLPVNVVVAWSKGQRVTELSTKDVVASSGAYTYGLARISKSIPVGEYTIVASAFEPQHTGSYSLKVESSCPFEIKTIPQEGAGMYSKVIRGAWEGESAAGAPAFDKYAKNPVFELDVKSMAQINIRLQLVQPSTAVPLNVTLYLVIQDNIQLSLSQKRNAATSGAYDSAIAGVTTTQTTIAAGRYYIVPSTYSPGIEAGFRILVYSSTPLTVKRV
ncbi:hypothetical protein D9613_007736 [Agrocybe pediades]|uniref:Calpain catalytic domain-containing protein n=1 Tax=Agrocybe pediades TaxID=84607 RepID=A0A8H4QPW3_9AGAR|nr:hypothetical protein D9613_007736 [Agrocybe pediades]